MRLIHALGARAVSLREVPHVLSTRNQFLGAIANPKEVLPQLYQEMIVIAGNRENNSSQPPGIIESQLLFNVKLYLNCKPLFKL